MVLMVLIVEKVTALLLLVAAQDKELRQENLGNLPEPFTQVEVQVMEMVHLVLLAAAAVVL